MFVTPLTDARGRSQLYPEIGCLNALNRILKQCIQGVATAANEDIRYQLLNGLIGIARMFVTPLTYARGKTQLYPKIGCLNALNRILKQCIQGVATAANEDIRYQLLNGLIGIASMFVTPLTDARGKSQLYPEIGCLNALKRILKQCIQGVATDANEDIRYRLLNHEWLRQFRNRCCGMA